MQFENEDLPVAGRQCSVMPAETIIQYYPYLGAKITAFFFFFFFFLKEGLRICTSDQLIRFC